MNKTAQLTGFIAAHAIVAISEGESLIMPLLVVEKKDGNPQFIEITGKTSQAAVAKGEKLLVNPGRGTRRAVLAFEAYLNLPPARTDAIFLRACGYRPSRESLLVAVPFRPRKSPGGFAVFRPKFIAYEDSPPPPDVLDDFLRGIALHPTGQKIWQAHLDESR
ncbi:MAG: hypothetical protein KY475_10720 [Planctomycetes bacterium]|nr:hypothetical protein [Planctomycetota bacterium]